MFGWNPLSLRGNVWVEPSIVEVRIFGSNPQSLRENVWVPLSLRFECLGRTLYR